MLICIWCSIVPSCTDAWPRTLTFLFWSDFDGSEGGGNHYFTEQKRFFSPWGLIEMTTQRGSQVWRLHLQDLTFTFKWPDLFKLKPSAVFSFFSWCSSGKLRFPGRGGFSIIQLNISQRKCLGKDFCIDSSLLHVLSPTFWKQTLWRGPLGDLRIHWPGCRAGPLFSEKLMHVVSHPELVPGLHFSLS